MVKPNLKCSECGRVYREEDKKVICDCGGSLDLEFNPKFKIETIDKNKYGLWRYRKFLPIRDEKNLVSFNEGFTPIIKLNIEDNEIYFKLDFLFPTGSFKDRGSTVLISKVKELGVKRVVEDSSGNAGASIASYCALGGIECDIFVPNSASKNKIKQIEIFGANLHILPFSREEVHIKAKEYAKNFYYASHFLNPYFIQGTKTIIYEIFEQLEFSLPDSLIIPVGNGSLLLGIYRGFKDLKESGLINKYPKIICVQSENCAPIYEAYKKKSIKIDKFNKKYTIAEGIAIAEPLRGKEILKVIYETQGEVLIAKEEEIILAQTELSKRGIFVEPTSAVQYLGLKKYIKRLKKKENIVCILTGSGLKSL
ncbi:MAG: threonine synthase [Caldisericia bacterium]|nr:threonine synthase [Caldisericia bacterium]